MRKSTFLVVASPEAEPLSADTPVRNYHCSNCGQSITANALAGFEPMCPSCGSDQVKPSEGASQAIGEDTAEAASAYLRCPNHKCDTRNIVSNDTLAGLNGSTHCIACGKHMYFKVPEDLAEAEAGEDEAGKEDEGAGSDSDSETEATDSETQTGDGDDGSASSESAEGPDSEDEDDETGLGGDSVGEEDEDEEEETEDDEVEVELQSVRSIDLAQYQEDTRVRFIRSSSNIIAFAGNIAVGYLNRDSASDPRAFDSEGYTRALHQAVSNAGLENALKEAGFEFFNINVDESTVRAKAAEQAAKKEQDRVRAEMQDEMAVFQQCLDIAAVGLNKGIFSNHENGLRAKLRTELESAGLRNPDRILGKVFSEHADEYHETLVNLAKELMGYSEQVRNDYANAVGLASYEADIGGDKSGAESAESAEASTDSFEDRLEEGGVSPSPAPKGSEVARKEGEGKGGTVRSIAEAYPRGSLF